MISLFSSAANKSSRAARSAALLSLCWLLLAAVTYFLATSAVYHKYQALVESKGGDFSPLVVGASGYIASSATKVLQTTCSSLDSSSSAHTRYTYDYWVSKASLSLQKSVSTEAIVRSSRASGRHSSSSSRDTFPDSVDIHNQMSG